MTLLILPFFVCGALAQPSAGIGFPSVAKALEALRSDSTAQFESQDGWVVVTSRESESPVMWSFTPSGHPAHPAVVKRKVVQKDGAISIEMSSLCEGPKGACDQLLEEFKQMNEQIKRRTRGGA